MADLLVDRLVSDACLRFDGAKSPDQGNPSCCESIGLTQRVDPAGGFLVTVPWKHFARSIFHRAGIEVVRYPGRLPGARRVRLLEHHGITVVFDVGANDGGYAAELREFGYQGKIVSFEPLTDAFARLARRSARDPGWLVENLGLGDTAGTLRINVAGNSTSSSILPMLESHLAAAPSSGYTGEQDITVFRLDDCFETYATGEKPFLKIDTQGFERQVLDGAIDSIQRIHGVQLEMSLVPLYAGTMLLNDSLDRMSTAGFELVSLEPGFTDLSTGRLLQADGIFMRG